MWPLAPGDSEQVWAVSFARVAGLPQIRTVPLPPLTVPEFDGALTKDVPGEVGTCPGEFLQVDSETAACLPSTFTESARAPSRVPLKRCGSRADDGPGVMTVCRSVATTLSPSLAAGWPTSHPPETQRLHHCVRHKYPHVLGGQLCAVTRRRDPVYLACRLGDKPLQHLGRLGLALARL